MHTYTRAYTNKEPPTAGCQLQKQGATMRQVRDKKKREQKPGKDQAWGAGENYNGSLGGGPGRRAVGVAAHNFNGVSNC